MEMGEGREVVGGTLGDKSGNLASRFSLLLTRSVTQGKSLQSPWVSVSAEYTLHAFGSTTLPYTPLPSCRWQASA